MKFIESSIEAKDRNGTIDITKLPEASDLIVQVLEAVEQRRLNDSTYDLKDD